jgi:hypothetical protein
MKKLYFLPMIFLNLLAIGQVNMGTIEVNGTNTATLKFSSNIQNVVFGNNPQVGTVQVGSGDDKEQRPIYKYFGNFTSGKTNIIKLNDTTAKQTSITIILDNEDVFYGNLKVGISPKIFYDFSGQETKQVQVKQLNDSLAKKIDETRMADKLKFVMSKEPVYFDLGVDENKMIFQVTNIVNDDKYTYLKLVIQNNSGSNYLIDNMIFKYVEGKKKGLKKSEAKIEERINPVIEPDSNSKILKAYSTSELGYVIPLFTVGSSGTLTIQMIEKNGTRNPKIEIEAKVMLKVKKLDFM